MPRQLELDLQFPLKGLDEGWAYRKQPGLSSPDCQNVRAFGTAEGRARGGQRPGLGKLYQQELGSGNPVRFLGQITTVQASGTGGDPYTDEDDFEQGAAEDLGVGWSAASWEANGTLYRDGGGYAYIPTVLQHRGNVRKALEFSTGSEYTIQCYCECYWNGTGLAHYKLYARMDNTTPVATTDGVIAQVTLERPGVSNPVDYSGNLKVYKAGQLDNTYDFSGGGMDKEKVWFKLVVNANNCKVYLDTTKILDQDITAQSGARVGVGGYFEGTTPQILHWKVTGQQSPAGGPPPYRTYLVGSAGGDVYSEQTIGSLTKVSGTTAKLSDSHLLVGFDYAQKLYIAEYGAARVAGSDGTIAANGTDLTASGVSDWTTYGIDKNIDVVVITEGTGSVNNGTYKISSVVAAKLVLASSAGGSGNCTYRVEKSPKVYDPSDDTVDFWLASSGKGSVPVGCPVGCLYRARAVLAGHETAPHVWYMSRQGDMYDWDYSQADAQRAVAGTSSEAGTPGDAIAALVPFADDVLLFGCTGSLWLLRGDPAWGGVIDVISHKVGILGKKAWCFGPQGEIYLMDTKGLYRLPRAAEGLPESLSQNALPAALNNINTDMYTVQLAWDGQMAGVHIYLTPLDANAASHYFWDQRTGGFWHDKNYAAHGPTCALEYNAAQKEYRHLILGGRDGYLRNYDPTYKSDDGSAIDSYVVYTPVRLSGSDLQEGVLLAVDAVLAEATDSLDYEIRVADSHEAALGASAFASGSWNSGGRQHRIRPRARGGSMCIKLKNSNVGETWMLENMKGISRVAGRQRRR